MRTALGPAACVALVAVGLAGYEMKAVAQQAGPTPTRTGPAATARAPTRGEKDAAGAAAVGILGLGLFGTVCAAVVAVPIYFLPTGIAFARGHRSLAPILLVNLLLGWTFVGYVVALVWAFTADQRPRRGRYDD